MKHPAKPLTRNAASIHIFPSLVIFMLSNYTAFLDAPSPVITAKFVAEVCAAEGSRWTLALFS
jgi:hypothetical protein